MSPKTIDLISRVRLEIAEAGRLRRDLADARGRSDGLRVESRRVRAESRKAVGAAVAVRDAS